MPHIALVCDWLTTPGGAEKVLLELHRMYPDAPIYTSQYSRKGINWFDDATVKTGWLQIFPASFRKILGPLRQLYFSHLDLSNYDIVISVTGAEAKSIRTKPKKKKLSKKKKDNSSPETALFGDESNWSLEVGHLSPRKGSRHLCYCHVPTQYYWQMYDKYVNDPGFGPLNPLVKLCFKLLVKPLRRADYCAAQQPDQFITISNYAKSQIRQYYDRDAVIVAPPVEVGKFIPDFPLDATSSHSSASSRAHNTLILPKPSTFPQISPQKSTNIPQVNHTFSTKSPKLSTVAHKNSTETAELSTNNPQLFHSNATTSPQSSRHLSTRSSKKSTASPQTSTNLSTKTSDLSTGSINFSTTFPQGYYIIACRQVTWKRVDLAIQACKKLNLPLLVVGDGAKHSRLVELASREDSAKTSPQVSLNSNSSKTSVTPISSSCIHFLPWATTEQLASYLQGAKGYIFPSLEPFGIAAVEALAAGCPVIAYAEGGSQDFIQDGINGLLFPEQTVASLTEALRKFERMTFDRRMVSRSAEKFDTSVFRQGITNLVQKYLNKDKK